MLLAFTPCRVMPGFFSSRLVLRANSSGGIVLLGVWSRFRCWTLLFKPAPGAASIDSISTTLGRGLLRCALFCGWRHCRSRSSFSMLAMLGLCWSCLILFVYCRTGRRRCRCSPTFGVLRCHFGGSRRSSGRRCGSCPCRFGSGSWCCCARGPRRSICRRSWRCSGCRRRTGRRLLVRLNSWRRNVFRIFRLHFLHQLILHLRILDTRPTMLNFRRRHFRFDIFRRDCRRRFLNLLRRSNDKILPFDLCHTPSGHSAC